MAIIFIGIIWICIAIFLILLFGWGNRGRAYRNILKRNKSLHRFLFISIIIFVFIFLGYVFVPNNIVQKTTSRKPFVEYSQVKIENLATEKIIKLDDQCDLKNPLPELVYNIPAILDAYYSEVEKPTIPRIVRLDDTLVVSFDGYKQFKNRGIRIIKKIQKKLGPRYLVKISSHETSHFLEVAYIGNFWTNEQLIALPVKEASIKEGVESSLLMSIIQHVSHFNFDYQSPRGNVGLLALDSGVDLEQVYMGAKILASFNKKNNLEESIALFFPLKDPLSIHENWRNDSLKKIWIYEVLKDVEYYKENGM